MVDSYSPIEGVESGTIKYAPEEERRRSVQRLLWHGFLNIVGFATFFFGLYTSGFYVRSIFQNNLQAWDLVNPGMYNEDRPDTNLMFSLHFIGGAILTIFGTLQFIPSLCALRM